MNHCIDSRRQAGGALDNLLAYTKRRRLHSALEDRGNVLASDENGSAQIVNSFRGLLRHNIPAVLSFGLLAIQIGAQLGAGNAEE